MNDSSIIATFFQALRPAADGAGVPGSGMPEVTGAGELPSAFPVTALAVAAIGTAAQALAGYMRQQFGAGPAVAIDRRLASFWFGTSLRPQGWRLPSVRDPVTGDYQARDGWLRVHANAPHHQAAALSVLGAGASHDAVARAISGWQAMDLENAIVQAGGCAAMMRTRQEWAAHPQGWAVGAEPLFHIEEGGAGPAGAAAGTRLRPLKGIKILDLTRVLAGPVSTRFLAAYGAQVLRIDPPSWTEPGMVPEVTLGKRCAMLDFRVAQQLGQMKALLAQADVIVHGYRADALERLGLGREARHAIRPGLVDVCLDAYGWSGPWNTRRGFDSLVQMSNGIACAGMAHFGRDRPTPLPVQALDQATGYLMAAAVLHGLTQRLQTGQGSFSRLSLARTGELLASQGADEPGAAQEARKPARASGGHTPFEPECDADYGAEMEMTDWGPARRLKPPCELEGVPMRWDYPASALRSSAAQWAP
ncbi:CoA transferase [Pollutimonas bauzanensis]|uniref:CoA-transferase family III n=1 Tax=Pollutimonas bauzanensis TaxID=658167 RepID=A0A1M5QTU1_9BURK|nr:CoA transferase [Pollutimonas bauzanensis]SHH17378.1 CoA-transferase family III [Pollutimonas bauzanensis]